MYNRLKEFFEIIEFGANLSTLHAALRNVKISFPISSVNDAFNNKLLIEKILNELFIRKHVMWEQPRYEDSQWCINSLKDLRDRCDEYAEKYRNNVKKTGDVNHFWATITGTWGSHSDFAHKQIVKHNATADDLGKILRDFRKKTYPIVLTLIYALPDGNLIKDEACALFDDGLKNSKLKFKNVLPNWTIQT